MEGDITYAREHRKQVRKALNKQKRGLPQRVFRGLLLDETPQTPEQTLGDFAEEYLRWKKGSGKDTERDRYCFAHLVAVLGDKRLPDMTRGDVNQYFPAPGRGGEGEYCPAGACGPEGGPEQGQEPGERPHRSRFRQTPATPMTSPGY